MTSIFHSRFLRMMLSLSLLGFTALQAAPAKKPAAAAENAADNTPAKEAPKKPAARPGLGGGPAYPIRSESPDESWKQNAGINPEAVKQAADRIDKVVEGIYKSKNVTPKAPASDEVFVRRVYLDLAGRIPTYQESTKFLSSKDVNKRENLVLGLVQSEGYVNHFYNYWAGLLRIQSYEQGMSNRAYERWVKVALRDNMPYDVFVRSLVTADGTSTPDNGATGFILRDRRQGVLDHVSQLSTVFLGSQIGCAMCHDAKFEKWKQKDFYALTAFFSEMTLSKDPKLQKELREQEQEKGKTPAEIREIRRQMRESPYIIVDRKNKEQTLPKDYKYDPALQGAVIKPAVLYGNNPQKDSSESRREAFAKWLTSPENPNFTKNIANRMWAGLFGIGLIEPLDDINDDNKPSSTALLDELTRTMVSLKYNMKAFAAAVAESKTYQRATSTEAAKWDTFAFESHPLRRLTAEQIWDSFFSIFMGERINQPGSSGSSQPHGDSVVSRTERNEMGQMSRPLVAENENGGMKSGAMAMNAGMSDSGNMSADDKEARIKKAAQAKRGGNDYGRGMLLSGDTAQPARPGTFLEQFGASLREIVTTGTTEPSVSQTLTLMNGRELGMVSAPNPQNALFANMQKAKDNVEAIRILYMTVMGREPRDSELALIKEFAADPVNKDKGAMMSDLAWALLNQREFLFYK